MRGGVPLTWESSQKSKEKYCPENGDKGKGTWEAGNEGTGARGVNIVEPCDEEAGVGERCDVQAGI